MCSSPYLCWYFSSTSSTTFHHCTAGSLWSETRWPGESQLHSRRVSYAGGLLAYGCDRFGHPRIRSDRSKRSGIERREGIQECHLHSGFTAWEHRVYITDSCERQVVLDFSAIRDLDTLISLILIVFHFRTSSGSLQIEDCESNRLQCVIGMESDF